MNDSRLRPEDFPFDKLLDNAHRHFDITTKTLLDVFIGDLAYRLSVSGSGIVDEDVGMALEMFLHCSGDFGRGIGVEDVGFNADDFGNGMRRSFEEILYVLVENVDQMECLCA